LVPIPERRAGSRATSTLWEEKSLKALDTESPIREATSTLWEEKSLKALDTESPIREAV
jgi:hypothetical protein